MDEATAILLGKHLLQKLWALLLPALIMRGWSVVGYENQLLKKWIENKFGGKREFRKEMFQHHWQKEKVKKWSNLHWLKITKYSH